MSYRNVHFSFVFLIWKDQIPALRDSFCLPKLTQMPHKTLKNYLFHLNPNLTALPMLPCSNAQSQNLNPHQRESNQLHREQKHPSSWFIHKHGEHDSCHGSDDSRSRNTQATLQSWPSRITENTLFFQSLELTAPVIKFPLLFSANEL